jgi:hypothetical protein
MLPILGTIQDVCALDVLAAQQCTAKVNNQKVPCKCPIEKVHELNVFYISCLLVIKIKVNKCGLNCLKLLAASF